MSKQFNEQEKEFILDCAKQHTGYKYIARQLHCDPQTIKNYCKNNNIIVDYRQKNRNLNENFFETIDNEEKAYFLGLVYTDGSVRIIKNSKQLRISLQLQDEEIIKKFLKCLNSDVKLLYDKRIGKEAVGFEIVNEKLVNDLIKLGVVPNKTYKSKHLPIVPEDFLIPFLRGLFDGDGILSYKENYNEASVGFVSYSYSVVYEFQQYIDKLINKKNSNKIMYHHNETSSKHYCHWRGRRQVLKILSLLYDNSNIYLLRKYNKYKRLLSTVDKDIV